MEAHRGVEALDRHEWPVSLSGCITPYSLNRRLDQLQILSGRCGKEINPFLPLGFEPHILLPVAKPLYRLSYRGSYIRASYIVIYKQDAASTLGIL